MTEPRNNEEYIEEILLDNDHLRAEVEYWKNQLKRAIQTGTVEEV